MGDSAGLLTVLGAVLVASLVGSGHCAGMCGALTLFAVGAADGDTEPSARRVRVPLHVGYHAGRAVSYAIVGVLAGSIGSAVDLGSAYTGLQRPAAIIAGVGLAFFGILALLRTAGARLPHLKPHPRYQKLVEAAHRAAFSMPPLSRAWLIGLFTPLLPCGWLYAFALTAAGSGHPLVGGAVMATFWLGTLPVLAAVGVGLQFVTGPLRRHLPIAASCLIVVVGVMTAAGRIQLPTFTPDSATFTVSDGSVAVPDADAPPACCALTGAESGAKP
jgi:sulfite exporter TauE/SafE